jgi:hypothetical protein
VRQSQIDVDVTVAPGVPIGLIGVPNGRRLSTYSVSGQLFPTTRLGVGLSYSRPDVEGYDADSYALSATWFFTRRVAVEMSLGRATTRGSTFEQQSDNVALSFTGRL